MNVPSVALLNNHTAARSKTSALGEKLGNIILNVNFIVIYAIS